MLVARPLEFSHYVTLGIPGVYREGLPIGNLYNFNVLYNSVLYNGDSAVTFAIDDAGGIDDTVTTIGYDTNSVADVHPEPGDVLTIGSEKVIVVSNTITDSDQGSMVVLRGQLNTSAASALDDAVITRTAGINNLLWKKDCIYTVFPPQSTITAPGFTKTEAVDPVSGMRIYVLEETRAGYNGATSMTVSCNFGVKVVRAGGVYRLVSIA